MQLKKEILTIKNYLKIFFWWFKFFRKIWHTLENLIADKISINRSNDDQNNFSFSLIKGYNVSSFLTKSEIKYLDEKNLHEKSRSKAFEKLLVCEKCIEGIKKVSSKKI